MTQDDVFAKLTPIFVDIFEEDGLVLTPEMNAEDVEEWDSLNHIRMIVAVEEEFGVSFSSAEVGGLKTVADLANLILSKSA